MTGQNDKFEAQRQAAKRRLAILLVGTVAGLAVGLAIAAGVYGIAASLRNAATAPAADQATNTAATAVSGPAPTCTAALDRAQRAAPFARGEVAAVAVASKPLAVPNLSFKDADGAPKTLADWRGKTVLFNLWATWCVPCRQEMPALNALQEKLGSDDFQVVTVNIDTRDPEKPSAWLKQNGVDKLGYFHDPSAKVFQDLKAVGKAFGMPTTLLIDPNGCEIASLAGPAEWAGEDAQKLIRAALGK
jgi:thiol-disulfide isomerase/thioredoxin